MKFINHPPHFIFFNCSCLYICGRDPCAHDKCIFRCVFWNNDKFGEAFEEVYRRINENEAY